MKPLLVKYLCFFLMLSGVVGVMTYKDHLISLFISMEFIALALILLCVDCSLSSVGLIMLSMCLAACEASVCLALLVVSVRRFGSDSTKSLVSFSLK